jgi:hypothetical protein
MVGGKAAKRHDSTVFDAELRRSELVEVKRREKYKPERR